MKVLEINSVCGIRSTGRIATEIAEYYQNRGSDVVIAYGRERVPDEMRKISKRIGSELSVEMNVAESRIFDNDGFTARRATSIFLDWAENFNPSILWLHNLHGYYINIEKLFSWIKSRPQMKVFWLLHDCWSFTGHCSHYSLVDCTKWQKGCYKCIQRIEYPKSLLLDNSKRNFERKREAFCGVKDMTIVTPSNWLAGEVKKGFLKEYNIIVRHNRINTDIFKPILSDFKNRYGIHDKKMLLAVAQNWDDKKGLSFLLQLSKELQSKYVIVIIGLTKKQKTNLPNNVIGLEKTDSIKELAEIYTAADVFVNPTFEDTFPTVNIEALACGTPVVTNDTGGSPEIAGNECGRIVYSKTVREFIEKIDECLNCCFSSDKCRKRALQFSQQINLDDVF